LRGSFAWVATGNIVYAACQWAVLSLIAKLGDAQMLGEYAYAVSLTVPLAMLAHLNLRAVLATDAARAHPFGDYLAVRHLTTLALLIAAGVLALSFGHSGERAGVILLVATMQAAENTSDVYYGALQRRDRLDQVAGSMILRGVLSVVVAALVLAWTRNLTSTLLAVAAVRIATLLLYDRPRGSANEDSSVRGSYRALGRLFRAALPLGAVLMLISLTSNIPRYAIEHYFGARELGAYAAAASFIVVGTTMVNALGQASTAPLARAWGGRDSRAFRRLAMRVVGVAVGLGIAGIAVAYVIGGPVLSFVYRPEYDAYQGLLVELMAAALVLYAAVAIGYVVTSTRSFAPQMPLLVVVAAASAIASWTLVPVIGLPGAAAAIALAGAVQCAGGAWILRRAFEGRP
jgi:O-antigen/teichoic acid export membrane protein